MKKEYDKALADWRTSIKLGANDQECYNGFAWLLATCPKAELRDGKKAVEYAPKACELTKWLNPTNLDTLAAAYAEAGNFKEAVRWQTKAVELAATKAFILEQEEAEARLALYKKGKPYREE